MKVYLRMLFVIIVLGLASCDGDNTKTQKAEATTTAKQAPIAKKKENTPTEKAPVAKSVALDDKINLGAVEYELLRARLIQKINEERKRLALQPFKSNNNLVKAARKHNDYMIAKNVLDHNQKGTNTPTVIDRVKKAGGKFRRMGENIQYEGFIISTMNGKETVVTPTYEELAEQIWQNWRTSPPHYENIIHPEFIFLGTAIRWSEKRRAVFSTQVYGG